MITQLNAKDRRIVKAKLKGKTDAEIGKVEYPNAKPESARVQVTTRLHKPHVAKYHAKELSHMLKKYGVTESRYLENIGNAMKADKVYIVGKGEDAFADLQPDHTVRLAANKQAERFLKFEQSAPQELLEGLGDMDEVELTKAVFRKSQNG